MNDWVNTLKGLAAGEFVATDQIINLVSKHLAHIGAFRLREDWDDLVQEVLISLLKSPPASKKSGQIVRHIQTTTYRKYIDEIRREQGRRSNSGGSGEASKQGWRKNVALEEVLELSEFEDFWSKQLDPGLRTALEGLEEIKRKVVECRYLLGCTNKEGSSRLEIPLRTYKRLLGQGLAELRDQLLPTASTVSRSDPVSRAAPSLKSEASSHAPIKKSERHD